MSILKVARMGHPVLRERARPLEKKDLRDPLLQKLIDDMIDTMHEYHGVGLAAPQVHEGCALRRAARRGS
jgi:peptide deformylase